MQLAKPHLDIGLFSNKRDEQLAFWQQTVGLIYDHVGKLGGGMQQHRHHMNGSILKMNHARDPLPALARSGIVGLTLPHAPDERRMFGDAHGRLQGAKSERTWIALAENGENGEVREKSSASGGRPERLGWVRPAKRCGRA